MNYEIEPKSNLAQFRRIVGYSQQVLAQISGVNLRMIQQYENRSRDINKASVQTVWLLAKALRCDVNDLIEIDVDGITNCIIKRATMEKYDTGAEEIKRTLIPAESKNDMNHGWKFNWFEIQNSGYIIIELFTKNDNKLQGRISYKAMDGYYFVSHAENAPQNVGKHGEYEGVAANMFAVVCKISKDNGCGGVVSFISKKDPKVMKNYANKLRAKRVGSSQLMIIDETAADYLIQSYNL